jgi:two-component system NtrC family sensor kinase
MTEFYYWLVLMNAAASLFVAVAVFWRNRYRSVGPLFSLTMVLVGVWLLGFAHYFEPMPTAMAVKWAKITLTGAILSTATLLHSMCALVDKQHRYRWWIVASYAAGLMFLLLLWEGVLVNGIKHVPYMDHYVRYNRALYPLLSFHIATWQFGGVAILVLNARRSVGYKRTQLIYFISAWLVIFLTTNSIILPLEYDINILPFGFLMLPLNLVFLGYVMGKARLADYNVFIARALLYTVTLIVIVVVTLLAMSTMRLVAPAFMNPQQILFSILLSSVIGAVLILAMPPLLPRVERVMQERMFARRFGYQDALTGLVKELSHLASLDELFQRTATTVHSQMQLTRVLILLQDPLSGLYRLKAESGLPSDETTDSLNLTEDAALIRWLQHNNDALVRDELGRNESAATVAELDSELKRLKVTVCIPMILEKQVIGLIALGPKASGEMFFVSDLKVLETLAAEIALALKYRRMEDQILRKNKLIELGTIAAGVAHEIRNPLASIRTFAQLLPDKHDDPEFKEEFSKLVLKDVDRITKVVESMLAFARPAQVSIADHSATEIVEEAVLLTAPRLKNKRIELTKQFHEKPVLRVDKQQILQVLVNLINNAADVLPEQGKIWVATGVRGLNGTNGGAGGEKFAVIEVADNGPGIPASVRNRVFDPFFTTKKEGTGLGLSISQKIARDHGGIITVSSVEGKGTTFQINLPLS